MKICNTCEKQKPLKEFGQHGTSADGYNPKCKSCVSEYNKQYRQRNRERIRSLNQKYTITHKNTARERTKQWCKDNSERKRKSDKDYYEKNKDRELAKSRERYQKNKERIKQKAKEYRENNRGKVNANIAKRRAAEKQATPRWANFQEIEKFYIEARQLSESTNRSYQVDHIVPLTSNEVCGLHCEANLQILLAKENNRKNNSLLE